MGAGFSGRCIVDDIGQPGLEDLPESCVALILSYFEPCEICRLALLNRKFRQASLADTVWETKLPKNYEILVKKLFTRQEETSQQILSKKDIYARLCSATRFAGDTMEIWMDKNNGGICVAISWKGLKITGITDRRYWTHISTDESRFQTIAYLQQIWWLEVEGNIEMEFPEGNYSLFFRMKLGRTSKRLGNWRVCNDLDQVHGWNVKPVQFQLSSSNGQQATAQHYLNEPATVGKWIHYYVGDFVVDQNDNAPTKLKFSMTQIDCTHSKGGLCLDSVFIYPSKLRKTINYYKF
ncbi:hypothetical protein ACH5RR_017073 [Cinchona calisaya]|uniref:F-box domain-containing protein n=1 Tax=Cinchona calisaya TaxID=153742 RepID=A0ABD2ZYX4_9GENT